MDAGGGHVGLVDRFERIGEGRVVAPNRKPGVLVRGFGDLGVGDQLPNVQVDDRAGVVHRSPGVLVDRGDRGDYGGLLATTTENRALAVRQAATKAALP